MILVIVNLIFLFLIFAVLAVASYQDIRHVTISYSVVIFLYILVPCYLVTASVDLVAASFCFMFTLLVFVGLWVISFKHFGFGDVLVISALGWMIANFTILRIFLIAMAMFAIPWAVFWFLKQHRDPNIEQGWHGGKRVILTKNLHPGMVLAEDGFMQGLTDADILRIQKNQKTINVKAPYPFIPVVFFTGCFTFLFPFFPFLHFI